MELKIFGSSSKGNCYILDNGKEQLIIEAGVKVDEIKKALNFDVSNVVGCLITHEHGDHAKYLGYILSLGIKIYASSGTHHKFPGYDWNMRPIIKEVNNVYEQFDVGSFSVKAFKTLHDAAEPLGFLIEHNDIGKLLFCTDSRTIPYKFNGLNHILIEANYSFDLVSESIIRDRVFTSHMEVGTAIDFLNRNDLSNVNNIVLLHLSDGNSNAKEFAAKAQATCPANVFIADSGINIDLNKEAF